MIAIKIGTTSFRQTATLAADEVQFTGTYVFEADGVTSAMIWDAGLNNVRAATQAERDAARLSKLRTVGQALVDQADADNELFRAGLLTTLDALNRQSRQFRDLLAAIAAASSLANLQTRVAAITPVEPARTQQELKDAVKAKIAAGDAD
jgi:hypothetical protein